MDEGVPGPGDQPAEQHPRELTRERFEEILGYKLFDYQWHWVLYYARRKV